MSYDEALADLKEQFGSEKLLDTDEVAAAIGRSREALAMMRLRKQFPQSKKIGRRVVVSIYDLAKFIAQPADEVMPVPSQKKPSKVSAPSAAKPAPSSKKTPSPMRRPPSLASALRAFGKVIDEQQAQLYFQNELFAKLEAIEIRRATHLGT
jgi:predicted DNA-binding transcriptional regulator AlpA